VVSLITYLEGTDVLGIRNPPYLDGTVPLRYGQDNQHRAINVRVHNRNAGHFVPHDNEQA